jgi:hypothetical protein
MRRLWIALLSVAFGVCHASAAPFAYTAQTRSVHATARLAGSGPSQSFSTTGTALFDQTAYIEHTSQFGGVDGWAEQSQRSELLPTSITLTGEFGGQNPPGTGTGDATGRTLTDITFAVATATDVNLNATASLFTDGTRPPLGARSIRLTGPNTDLAWTVFNDGIFLNWPGTRSQDLSLQPGSYRFVVDFESVRGGFQVGSNGVGAFDISLTQVPEPATFSLLVLPALIPMMLRRRRH